jgi:hypothetical protein
MGARGFVSTSRTLSALAKVILSAGLLLAVLAPTVQAQTQIKCSGQLPAQPLVPNPPDLLVEGNGNQCFVPVNSTNYYGNIIVRLGGKLIFNEPQSTPNSQTHLWAASIIVENEGTLYAVSGLDQTLGPYGAYGGTLTIHLYGKNEATPNSNNQGFATQNLGALCSAPTDSYGPCSIPKNVWNDNGANLFTLPSDQKVQDYFYAYGPLRGDARCDDGTIWKDGACPGGGRVGHFGNKVFAVSYGGTLGLYGYKGASYSVGGNSPFQDPLGPTSSGSSWIRLQDGKSLEPGDTQLWLETPPVTWSPGDEFVVTTTDYLPSHSEKLRIDRIDPGNGAHLLVQSPGKIQWPHNGLRYGGPADDEAKKWTIKGKDGDQPGRLVDRVWNSVSDDLRTNGAETRAAVALLTRSIRIVSAGDVAGADFGHRQAGNTDPEDPNYSYGAHLVVRQGAVPVQIRGVEFVQMGQGGRQGHYPIHFHMARRNYGAWVKDSTINESMTRWIVLHATQGVTLARNVGYKSIGHGYYLEDGTETDNKLYSNIGILARAAVDNVQNPRKVPGILAYNDPDPSFSSFPYRSDNVHPSVFWITNGWNDFVGNMAAGAGACGAAYWLVPAANTNMMEVRPPQPRTDDMMKWSGYSALQKDIGYAGTTPLKSFYKNYATSTMHSFQTTADAPACAGFAAANAPPGDLPVVKAISSLAPPPAVPNDMDHYYPHVIGGARRATHCPYDKDKDQYNCTDEAGRMTVPACAAGAPPERYALKFCGVTVLDHFTTSFHWADGNISAIWLRPQWYVMTNSVVSDVQNGGLTMVSGGDYTHASVIPGYYGLVRNSVFIGNTRDNDKYPFSRNTGPFNDSTQLRCISLAPDKPKPNYCLNADEGISMPVNGFFTNQRFLNIYDGPFYQDSNAFLDITPADCPLRGYNSDCMYGRQESSLLLRNAPGTPPSPDPCLAPKGAYVPNAAIGWKQPNGFFYPPAFHSKNLFFDNVALRHFVIDPLFNDNTYVTDAAKVQEQYCTNNATMFNNFSANDRQTTLTDEDGTLTGLTNSSPVGPLNLTFSINEDPFFKAPVETAECGSAIGDNASPGSACKVPPQDPKLPPATAKTSPYDHLKVVVYPQIPPGWEPPNNPSPVWQSDCANQACYGVPLFRQYLTKDEMAQWDTAQCDSRPGAKECRWPFIRMAGFNFAQRESLVINNGKYYLDTTVDLNTQQTEPFYDGVLTPRRLNVFEPGKTYYVFFVHAKQSTTQTYQIYVGPSFDKASVVPQRVVIDTQILAVHPALGESWLKQPPDFNPSTGIVTVTVDFTGFDKLLPNSDNGLCKPELFCKPVKDKDKVACTTALDDSDSRVAVNRDFLGESDAVCQNWAMKSLDCPTDGCRGFSFTLPVDFKTGSYQRPRPEAFPTAAGGTRPQGGPDWSTRLLRVTKPPDDSAVGRCYYDKVPGTDCSTP